MDTAVDIPSPLKVLDAAQNLLLSVKADDIYNEL
jgi:hypothetical protein